MRLHAPAQYLWLSTTVLSSCVPFCTLAQTPALRVDKAYVTGWEPCGLLLKTSQSCLPSKSQQQMPLLHLMPARIREPRVCRT